MLNLHLSDVLNGTASCGLVCYKWRMYIGTAWVSFTIAHSSPNILTVIKWERIRWDGNEAHVRKLKILMKYLTDNLHWRDHLGKQISIQNAIFLQVF